MADGAGCGGYNVGTAGLVFLIILILILFGVSYSRYTY